MDLDIVRIYVSVPQEAALWANRGIPAVLTARNCRTGIPGYHDEDHHRPRPFDQDLACGNRSTQSRPSPETRAVYVTAKLVLEEHVQALALLPAALVSDKTGKAVFVVEGGTAKRVAVKTGLDDGMSVEITEGLQENMEVIIISKTGLTDGQAVQASPYNLPAGKPASQKL